MLLCWSLSRWPRAPAAALQGPLLCGRMAPLMLIRSHVLVQERACIVRGKQMEVDKRKKYVRWLSNQNAVSF